MVCFGPAVLAGPEARTEATTAANSGFTLASSRCSSAGLRQPARRSRRLLKEEAQPPVPASQVRKPADR